MKNCLDFEERASSFLEKEMPEDESRSFQTHLDACDECREKIRRLEALRSRLQSLPSIETRPDFESVLRARIQMSKRIGRRSWKPALDGFRVPAYGLALAAIVLLIFSLHVTRSVDDSTISRQLESSNGLIGSAPDIQSGDFVYTLDIVEAPHDSAEKSGAESKAISEQSAMIVVISPTRVDSAKMGAATLEQTAPKPLSTAHILSF